MEPAFTALSAVALVLFVAYAVYLQTHPLNSHQPFPDDWRGYALQPYIVPQPDDAEVNDRSMIITDLTLTTHPAGKQRLYNAGLEPPEWYRLEKDLYSHTGSNLVYLNIAQQKEKELFDGTTVVIDVRIGQESPNSSEELAVWESRAGDIWLRRRPYVGNGTGAFTAVDVLYGLDAAESRPQWHITDELILPYAKPGTPIPRFAYRRK